jgi:large subunit ribosomal protein L29
MKILEVRQLTNEELHRKLEDRQRDLFAARIDRYTENAPDTSKTKQIRRDIARIRTILHESELGINRARHAAVEPKEG